MPGLVCNCTIKVEITELEGCKSEIAAKESNLSVKASLEVTLSLTFAMRLGVAANLKKLLQCQKGGLVGLVTCTQSNLDIMNVDIVNYWL